MGVFGHLLEYFFQFSALYNKKFHSVLPRGEEVLAGRVKKNAERERERERESNGKMYIKQNSNI